jgi:hypothetical protein
MERLTGWINHCKKEVMNLCRVAFLVLAPGSGLPAERGVRYAA